MEDPGRRPALACDREFGLRLELRFRYVLAGQKVVILICLCALDTWTDYLGTNALACPLI